MKNLRKFMSGILCLIVIGVLIAGCGGGGSSSSTTTASASPSASASASTSPSSSPSTSTNLVLNATTAYTDLAALTLPATYNGFTIGASVAFDNTSSAKTYTDTDDTTLSGTYVARIKLGGSDPTLRSLIFTANAGDKVTVLAMSSSSTGTGRDLGIALVTDGTAGTATDMGEAGTSGITKHTYTITTAGTYTVYSLTNGINIYYISVIGS